MLLVPTSTVNLTNTHAKKTDEEKQSTKKALLNKDFRQAISLPSIVKRMLLNWTEKTDKQDHP